MEKENLQHFFNGCNKVNEISKNYFDKFRSRDSVQGIRFLLRGAPTLLIKSKILLLNIEIVIFCSTITENNFRG